MKTKEFIKMLKEADPSGECYIRFDEGVPYDVEVKDGLWDGPYEYIENNEFVISTRHDKIDIYTKNYEDWIEEHDGDYSKIKLDLKGYSDEILKGEKEHYRKKFEKISKECKKIKRQLTEHSFFEICTFLKNGWKIKEIKGKNNFYSKYTMEFSKGFVSNRMNVGECEVVCETGLFEKYDENDKFMYWKLKQ